MPRKSRIRRANNITFRRRKIRGGDEKTSEEWAKDADINSEDIKKSISGLLGYDSKKGPLYSPKYSVYNSSYVDVYFKTNGKNNLNGEKFINNVNFIKDFFKKKSTKMTDDDVMLVYISFNLFLNFLKNLSKEKIQQIDYDYFSDLADTLLDNSLLTVKLNRYVIFFRLVRNIQSKIDRIIEYKFKYMATLPVVTPPPQDENNSSENEYEDDFEEEYADDFEEEEYEDDFADGGRTRRGTRTAKPKRGKKRKQTKKRYILRQKR